MVFRFRQLRRLRGGIVRTILLNISHSYMKSWFEHRSVLNMVKPSTSNQLGDNTIGDPWGALKRKDLSLTSRCEGVLSCASMSWWCYGDDISRGPSCADEAPKVGSGSGMATVDAGVWCLQIFTRFPSGWKKQSRTLRLYRYPNSKVSCLLYFPSRFSIV